MVITGFVLDGLALSGRTELPFDGASPVPAVFRLFLDLLYTHSRSAVPHCTQVVSPEHCEKLFNYCNLRTEFHSSHVAYLYFALLAVDAAVTRSTSFRLAPIRKSYQAFVTYRPRLFMVRMG